MDSTTRVSAHKGLVRLNALQNQPAEPEKTNIGYQAHPGQSRSKRDAGDAVIRLIMRSRTLLPFEYTLGELLYELGLSANHRKKFGEWCRPTYPNPIPHTHDVTGHVIVHGWAFRDWIRSQLAYRRRRLRTKLPPGYLWCPGCNRPQQPHNAVFDEVNNRRRMIAVCEKGHRMSQFVAFESKENT